MLIKNNSPLINSEDFMNSLASLLDGGRFPHAILIEGASGSGKKTLATFIASAVLCKNEHSPCNECTSCKKIFSSNHPDLYILKSDKKTLSIGVDDVRGIRRNAFISPHESEKKIYIIPDAQHMTVASQNALLKVLEEPPRTVIFILTATSKESLLETMVSRLVCLKASILDKEDRLLALTKLTTRTTEELEPFASSAKTVGQALAMLEDSNQLALITASSDVVKFALDFKKYELLKLLISFTDDRERFKTLISEARIQAISVYIPKKDISLLRCRVIADILKDTEYAVSSNVSISLLASRLTGALCKI